MAAVYGQFDMRGYCVIAGARVKLIFVLKIMEHARVKLAELGTPPSQSVRVVTKESDWVLSARGCTATNTAAWLAFGHPWVVVIS